MSLSIRSLLVTLVVSLLVTLAAAPVAVATASSNTVSNYRCGSTELRVLTTQQTEGKLVQVAFMGPDGKPAYPDLIWNGDFVSLCHLGVFALLDTSLHHRPGPSFLMTSAPRIIGRYEFGEIAEFGGTADEKLLWIQSYSMVNGVLVTNLWVLDYRGREILKKAFRQQTLETLKFEGRNYQFAVRQPSFPG
jgi:hypothetical protein